MHATGWAIIAVCTVILVLLLAALFILQRCHGGRVVEGGARATAIDSQWRDDISEVLSRYEMSKIGGEVIAEGGAPKSSRGARWQDHASWKELAKDPAGREAYLRERTRVLGNLRLDWRHVLDSVSPLLAEDREYFGLIGADAAAGSDPQVMRILALEPSPLRAGEGRHARVGASVPGDVVAAMAERPALFLWHSHPYHGRPYPSPTDVAFAILCAYREEYAANIVISRYGVSLVTLEPVIAKRIRETKDPGLAVRHLCFDVVSAMCGMRSWVDWTLEDYRDILARYGVLYVVWPSPNYVSDANTHLYNADRLAPTDTEIIEEYRRHIEEYLAKRAK